MDNEKGFTLVEILASITILFIILITFFGFFTQSALFTRTNQEALYATNLANHAMEVIRSGEVDDIENLSATIMEEIGVNEDYQFIEYEDFSLKLTSLGVEEDLGLTKVKIEIIHIERAAVLATRYSYVGE